MFNSKDLVGALLQGGLTKSGGNRIDHALGDRGLGGPGGVLGQLLGGTQGNAGGTPGGLAGRAKSMLEGAGRSVKGGDPLAIGGLGALAGALLGGGGRSVKGAIGGGAMALLAGLAVQALQNRNREPAAGDTAPAPLPSAAPPGLRPPASPAEEGELQSAATLVLRAMLNAAKADGQIDGVEMQRILGKIQEAGADPEALEFVRNEMGRPLDLDGLIRQVSIPQMAAEVYAASLLAIEVDTAAERDYLQRLAQGLRLPPEAVQRLHSALGVA